MIKVLLGEDTTTDMLIKGPLGENTTAINIYICTQCGTNQRHTANSVRYKEKGEFHHPISLYG